MEAAGVAVAVANVRQPHLVRFGVAKSVSDMANRNKSDTWHKYAAHTSAAFTISFVYSDLSATHPFFDSSGIRVSDDEILNLIAPSRHTLFSFEKEIIESIYRSMKKEMTSIVNGRFESKIDRTHNYLIRAEAIFKTALEVYAVSIDGVSDFWVSLNGRSEIDEYSEAQRGKTARLFVFSDADKAHSYRSLLDRHEKIYKNVFICSLEAYEMMCHDDEFEQTGREVIKRDFAVVKYVDDIRGQREIFAELDSETLQYDDISNITREKYYYKKIASLLNSWKDHTKPGTFASTTLKVFRWQENFAKQGKEWAQVLKDIFDSRNADALHMIMFNLPTNKEDQIRHLLANAKNQILTKKNGGRRSIAESFDIKRIWIGRRMFIEPRYDAITGGKIIRHHNSVANVVMYIRFNSKSDLDRFYESRELSLIRRELLSGLDDHIRFLYEEIDNLNDGNEDKMRNYYELIEVAAARILQRFDFLDDEYIEQMVGS